MRVSVESGDRVIYDDSGLSTHGDSPMPQIKVATEDPVAQRVAHDTQAGVDISEDPEKARERRLTQLQLERFRRSMSKATRRTLHPRASVLSNDLGVPAVRKVCSVSVVTIVTDVDKCLHGLDWDLDTLRCTSRTIHGRTGLWAWRSRSGQSSSSRRHQTK